MNVSQKKSKDKGDAVAKPQASVEHRPNDVLHLTSDFADVYVKRRPDGKLMRPVKAIMTLHESRGQIYKVSKKWAITNDGYKFLNKVASVSIVTPQKVSMDGQEMPNPVVERDPDTKVILTVNVRKMGVGYSPAGNMVVIDKTLYYNVYTYFIQSIQAKMNKEEWKWDSAANKSKPTGKMLHPDAARIGTKDDKPKTDKGKWVFLPTAPPLGLWINYMDKAIQECLEEHTQRQRFGDRIAQTIVERNILKAHPAIAVGQVEVGDASRGKHKANVTVWGWRHEDDSERLEQVVEQAARGAKEIKVADVEVVQEVIEPDMEEEAQVVEEEAAEEGATEKPAKSPFEGDPASTDPEREREPGEEG